MSNTISAPALSESVAWKQAADDVFVATDAGEFAGYIAVQPGAHVLFDAHGGEIGTYETVSEARRALTEPRAPRRGRLLNLLPSRRRRHLNG